MSAHDTNPLGPKATQSKVGNIYKVSGRDHKQRCLEQAPAEVLMLWQLAATTKRIVAWIDRPGIIAVLLQLRPRKNNTWLSTFSL